MHFRKAYYSKTPKNKNIRGRYYEIGWVNIELIVDKKTIEFQCMQVSYIAIDFSQFTVGTENHARVAIYVLCSIITLFTDSWPPLLSRNDERKFQQRSHRHDCTETYIFLLRRISSVECQNSDILITGCFSWLTVKRK